MRRGVRLTDLERGHLDTLIASEGDKIKEITFSKVVTWVSLVAEVSGQPSRKPGTIWSYVKRRANIPDRFKKPKKDAEDKSVKKEKVQVIGFGPAARKVLEELKPVMGFMGKPAEYLLPLEDMLVENTRLVESLKAAEERNAVSKAAAEKIKHLENRLSICKKILRETCRLRQEALTLTKLIDDFKKKEGVDVFAFLAEDE